MKKLNNKGMTIVEILITFIIIAAISVSLYASIANLKGKEEISSYKERINTYKNLLTRDIQNDVIMKKLIDVKEDPNDQSHITLVFENNEEKDLKVNQSNVTIPENPKLCKGTNSTVENNESIQYGDETFQIPILGKENIITGDGCTPINRLQISDYVLETDDDKTILTIKISLFHPDLGDKFSINIAAPINYN